MKHLINTRHDHFGRVHSFTGNPKEVYQLIRILIHDGVGFRFLPTHTEHCVVSFISDEDFQGLVKKGRIHPMSNEFPPQ